MPEPLDIGLDEALARTLETLRPLPPVTADIWEANGLVTAADCIAAADCPSVDSCLKDGFAVLSSDLEGASPDNPVALKVTGRAVAGRKGRVEVAAGTAVEVATGAELPEGADAVLPIEFTRREGAVLLCLRDTSPMKNVQRRGSDVAAGERVALRGEVLTPALTGLMAAAGMHSMQVHPMPRVGIVAIGDEVTMPGKELRRGELYASNAVTLKGWLDRFRFTAEVAVAGDRESAIAGEARKMLEVKDALITSGGVWKSDRDLTVKVLQELGGDLLFHRVRIGPGKALAVALVGGTPVFCLPGGPASNEMAFLQIALPGLLKMAGRNPAPFPRIRAVLSADLEGIAEWTQFWQADLRCVDGEWSVAPIRKKSRLQSQARANALLQLPEGMTRLANGREVAVQVLFWPGEAE